MKPLHPMADTANPHFLKISRKREITVWCIMALMAVLAIGLLLWAAAGISHIVDRFAPVRNEILAEAETLHWYVFGWDPETGELWLNRSDTTLENAHTLVVSLRRDSSQGFEYFAVGSLEELPVSDHAEVMH